jgi:Ca-activated chloride channel family protein
MQFAQPDQLVWLWAAPALLVAYMGYVIWKRRVRARLGHSGHIAMMMEAHSERRQHIRAACWVMSAALLAVALAQPQWGQTDRVIKRTGVDVVFALDLSRSMLAQDNPPNRLRAAKDEIEATLSMLNGDRAGLVVFTAISFAQSPLTTDYGALRFYMSKLMPDQMPFGGTSIGRAVQDAVDLLTGVRRAPNNAVGLPMPLAPGEAQPKMKRAKNQIIVIFTDGEDHESDPMAAAALASGQHIRIVTVGMGTAQGERIPVYKDDGSLAGFKRDRKGETVYTRLNEASLVSLAERTGGIYIRYAGPNSVANALIDYIDSLEKTELETLMRQRYRDRFTWFLWPALVLLMISAFLGERRRPQRRSAVGLLGVLVLGVGMLGGCADLWREELEEVARGNEAVEQERWADAIAAYEAALREQPDRSELHYNLGRALLGAGELDRARESLARALATEDKGLRAKALYNLGLVLSQQEQWRQAWETFQQVVALLAQDPEQRTGELYRDALHNLEVAYWRMHPPCAKLEDDREEDDSAGVARLLEGPTLKRRTLCGLDEDWHRIAALPGTQLEVEAIFRPLREDDLEPERPFLPRPESLQIALFTPDGERVFAIDQGIKESEPVVGQGKDRRVRRHIARMTLSADSFKGQPADQPPFVLLQARADEDLEFSYELTIKAIPPCEVQEDEHEDNDSVQTAKPLEAGSHRLHTCPGDEDWFTVALQAGDTLFIDVRGEPDAEREQAPALELEVYDAAGRRLAQGTDDGGTLTAALWQVREAGNYAVRVRGADTEQQGPYALALYPYRPCPEGGDRYEDNNTAAQATKLDGQVPQHRYLRLCPDDVDYYSVPLVASAPPVQGGAQGSAPPAQPAKPGPLGVGLKLVRRPGQAEAAQREETPLRLDLMSPSGDQILVEGQAPAPLDAKDDKSGPPKGAGLDLVLTAKPQGEQALVRVQGPPLYYHLVQLEPPQQSDKQDQQQQDPQQQQSQGDPKQQEQPGDEPQDEQQGRDDKQGGDKPQDDKQEGQGEDGQQEKPTQDEAAPKGEQTDKQQGEREEQAQEDAKAQDELRAEQGEGDKRPGEQDPEAQRIEAILEALEQTDSNFQMRKALENTPGRYIEKDW